MCMQTFITIFHSALEIGPFSYASRTYVTCKNMLSYVRTYVTHENMMFLVQNDVTYENVICPIYCYIRKWVMSNYMLHTNMRVFYPNLFYMRKCNMSEPVLHEYEMFSVRTLICNIRNYNISEPMLHTNI